MTGVDALGIKKAPTFGELTASGRARLASPHPVERPTTIADQGATYFNDTGPSWAVNVH
jgi:hypothetical protein